MKFDYMDHTDDTVGWFFLEAITAEDRRRPGFVKELMDKKPYDVVLTINGRDVDFVDVIENWERQIDGMVERKAKRLAFPAARSSG